MKRGIILLKKLKKLLLVLAASGLFLTGAAGFTQPAQAAVSSYQSQDLSLDVKAAIAIDASTGQVLYAKNANTARSIASMTKLVTVYLTMQAIKQGKLSWDTKVKPTKAIAKVSQNTEYSNVRLDSTQDYTVKQLYQATLIESANGAAMTLAKAVSGNQVAFVKKMRALLASWGSRTPRSITPAVWPTATWAAPATQAWARTWKTKCLLATWRRSAKSS